MKFLSCSTRYGFSVGRTKASVSEAMSARLTLCSLKGRGRLASASRRNAQPVGGKRLSTPTETSHRAAQMRREHRNASACSLWARYRANRANFTQLYCNVLFNSSIFFSGPPPPPPRYCGPVTVGLPGAPCSGESTARNLSNTHTTNRYMFF